MLTTSRPHGPVLVVDDDDEVRGFVAVTLGRGGYAVSQANSGEAALDAVQEEPPAVALVDICLPGISGYDVCYELRKQFGDGLPIIVISGARTDSCDRTAALLVGADEFLTKPISPGELLIRVSRMIRRSTPLNPIASARLTGREREILRLIAEGLRPRDIAVQLVITDKTVSTHINHIFTKLGVHNRAQAVALAFKRDLVDTPT
jgi:DNA-binding NarL/FixJ family response regulator